MEDGLGEYPELEYNVSDVCLNPCFNGRWTRRELDQATDTNANRS